VVVGSSSNSIYCLFAAAVAVQQQSDAEVGRQRRRGDDPHGPGISRGVELIAGISEKRGAQPQGNG